MPDALTIARSEFILGGQKSGKSRRGEMLAQQWLAMSVNHRAVLIATAQPWDEEMRARILRHQADRAQRVPGMQTNPLALNGAPKQGLPASAKQPTCIRHMPSIINMIHQSEKYCCSPVELSGRGPLCAPQGITTRHDRQSKVSPGHQPPPPQQQQGDPARCKHQPASGQDVGLTRRGGAGQQGGQRPQQQQE